MTVSGSGKVDRPPAGGPPPAPVGSRRPGPGWYRDPWRHAAWRWWDGARWCGWTFPSTARGSDSTAVAAGGVAAASDTGRANAATASRGVANPKARRRRRWIVAAAGVLVLALGAAGLWTLLVGPHPAEPQFDMVSVSVAGVRGNADGWSPALTEDGTAVAFESQASNLVPGDTNGSYDVFVHDRLDATTVRVSVGSRGEQADGSSFGGSLSGDGRRVVFRSEATNLVRNDTNEASDVFVHDLDTGATTRVSVSSAGEQGEGGSWDPVISADGRYVVFNSEATNLATGPRGAGVYVHDLETGSTDWVGPGRSASVSGDGASIVLLSDAALAPEDDNGATDVYVHDRGTGKMELVSVSTTGTSGNGWCTEAPAINEDGRFVVFTSSSSDLVADDANAASDVFLRDRQTSTTIMVSVTGGEQLGDSRSDRYAISNDGTRITFTTTSFRLFPPSATGGVYIHERPENETSPVRGTSPACLWPALSGDGQVVAFATTDSSAISEDTQQVVLEVLGPRAH